MTSQYFLDFLSNIIDYYSNVYDNHIVVVITIILTLSKIIPVSKGPDYALTLYLQIENIFFKVLPHLKQD